MSDSNNQNKGEQQSFTIQPHPATTNHPSNDPSNDPALNSGLKQGVFGGKPGPALVNASQLEEPLSRQQLAKRSAELNK